MTTYFLLGKKSTARPLSLLQPSNAGAGGSGPNNNNNSNSQNHSNSQNGGSGGAGLDSNSTDGTGNSSFNGGGGNSNSGNNNTNNNGSLSNLVTDNREFSRGGSFSLTQQFQNIYQNQPNFRQQSSNPVPPLRSSSSHLQHHWATSRDSPRLPVISEQEVVLSPLLATADDLSFSDTSQRLPSYNEPKPIIPKVPSEKKIVKNVELSQWIQPLTGSSASNTTATSRDQLPLSLMNSLISPEQIGYQSNQGGFQETDLDSFSQHAYGAIQKPSHPLPSNGSKLPPATDGGFFCFDKNSSIAIKSQVMLNEQMNQQPNPFFSSSNMSPPTPHRRHHNRAPPSLADTTKATIQSVESDLDQMMLIDDDDVQLKPFGRKRGDKNRGEGGHNMSQLEDASYIYNISSNESEHSAGGAFSDSPYGHIIKRSSGNSYAKECIENDFYKNNNNRNKKKSSGSKGVGLKGGAVGKWNGGHIEEGDDDKNDYCVFIRREEPPPLPPMRLGRRKENFTNSPSHRPSSSAHHHQLKHQNNHHHSKPNSHLERTSRHYQAHNSPLIVHRFYHIDDNENVGGRGKHGQRGTTSLTANTSSPFNGRKVKHPEQSSHRQSNKSHGSRSGPSKSSKRENVVDRPLMPPFAFASPSSKTAAQEFSVCLLLLILFCLF